MLALFFFSFLLSPSNFNSGYANATVLSVNTTGILGDTAVSYSLGVRPVVNLSADVLISGGDGTAINPYVVVK